MVVRVRRVSVHAITVVAVSTAAVVAVAAGLAGSPQQATVATAEAPAGSTLIPQPVRSVAAAVEEAARSVRTDSRSKERVALAATKATKAAAVERQLVLTAQGKSIASRQSVIVRQRAELRRQRAAAEAKRKKAIAKRGYLPGTTNPREIAKQILKNKYGYGPEQYSCFNNIIMRESMWRHQRHNAELGRVRHPAGAARQQDGDDRAGLADQPGHPDHLGHRVHEGPLRQPLRCVGVQELPRLVLKLYVVFAPLADVDP